MERIITEMIRCELKDTKYTIESNKYVFPDHLHDFYEVCIVLNDKVNFITESGSHLLHYNNLIVIPPNKFHHAVTEQGNKYKRIIIWFNISNGQRFNGIRSLLKEVSCYDFSKDEILLGIINSFVNLVQQANKELLMDIAESFISSLLFSLLYANNLHSKKTVINPTIMPILEYIENNPQKRLKIEDLSHEFNISQSYLQKLFKDTMHISIINYVREKKLLYSKTLIKQGEQPYDVCFECGFNDYSSFYKAFVKQFGISPKEIKQKNQ